MTLRHVLYNNPKKDSETMKARIFTNYEQLAPAHSVLQQRAFYKGQKPDPNAMRQAFSPQELARIVYFPVVIARVAFSYVEDALKICAAKRMGTARLSRVAKSQMQAYRYAIEDRFEADDRRNIDHIEELFRSHAAWHLKTLWYTISNDLKRNFPQWEDYEPWTTLHLAVHMLQFVCAVERENDGVLSRRMNIRFDMKEDIHLLGVASALLLMLKDADYDSGEMDERCMTILRNTVRTMDLNGDVPEL